jgi:hypothetical protein
VKGGEEEEVLLCLDMRSGMTKKGRETGRIRADDSSVWRSTLILSASAMYIMWAITFLAQLNPLIVPVRGNLRGPGDHASEPPQMF